MYKLNVISLKKNQQALKLTFLFVNFKRKKHFVPALFFDNFD